MASYSRKIKEIDFFKKSIRTENKHFEIIKNNFIKMQVLTNSCWSFVACGWSLLIKFGFGAQTLQGAPHRFGQMDRVPRQPQSATGRATLVFLVSTFGTAWVLAGVVRHPRNPEHPVGVEVVFGRAGGHCWGREEQEAELRAVLSFNPAIEQSSSQLWRSRKARPTQPIPENRSRGASLLKDSE